MTPSIACLILALATTCHPESGHPAASPSRAAPASQQQASTDWDAYLDQLEKDHFRGGSSDAQRLRGFQRLRSIKSPDAFLPMIQRFHDQKNDIREVMLDHFAEQGEPGQVALAWTAIHSRDPILRNESTARLTRPAGYLVQDLVDSSLRHANQHIATHAARLVNTLEITDAIPLLINIQITSVENNRRGAPGGNGMIRSGQQISYVAGVRPVFGPGVVAYQPIVGTINEGFAVESGTGRKLVCRAGIHDALVELTTRETGTSTESFGYDVAQWHEWHQETYLPFKEEQRRKAERLESIRRRAAEIERERSEQAPAQ